MSEGDLDVVLCFGGEPEPKGGTPRATLSEIIERPRYEAYQPGGRVFVKGQDTYIEVKPQPDWFETRLVSGMEQVFFKFQCTGLEPITYGPFQDQDEATLALHHLIHGMLDALLSVPVNDSDMQEA